MRFLNRFTAFFNSKQPDDIQPLSEEEAILACLTHIANVDKEFHPREKKQIERIALKLGLKPSAINFTQWAAMDYNAIILALSNVPAKRQPDLFKFIYQIIRADGIEKPIEYESLDGILDEMDVHKSAFVSTIFNANLL